MNTYNKYAPNIFLAKCENQHKKGEIIKVTTKYGKENECVIHNLIIKKGGYFFYSITRNDGFNIQERAKQKAEKYRTWQNAQEKQSNKYYEASHEGAEFLRLGEPIKVGHHSEKRHRALIERNHNRMGKCVEATKKAKEHAQRAEYWQKQEGKINESMPESVEYFTHKLEKAKEYHAGLKSGKYKKSHSYSVTYAKKEVNILTKKLKLAQLLWS